MSENTSTENNKQNIESYAAKARENFLQGYNCSQAVVLAFADLIRERVPDLADVSDETLLRIASPFGGGMGRMREVCGAVSGSFVILGLLEGYHDPKAYEDKKELYAKVQELAAKYREENGSIICRELLAMGTGVVDSSHVPEKRTEEYYKKRPCGDICGKTAGILAEYLSND